jgi:hypothetical protein
VRDVFLNEDLQLKGLCHLPTRVIFITCVWRELNAIPTLPNITGFSLAVETLASFRIRKTRQILQRDPGSKNRQIHLSVIRPLLE